ncbi:hypothetical protein B0H11DRAFT_1910540 [Mycena galericulata]|nr:hypothetical protein B0H11DRAFT_1910540 [Mycena galericulata]
MSRHVGHSWAESVDNRRIYLTYLFMGVVELVRLLPYFADYGAKACKQDGGLLEAREDTLKLNCAAPRFTLSHPIVTDGTHLRSLHDDFIYIDEPTVGFLNMNWGVQSFTYADYLALTLAKIYEERVKDRGGCGRHLHFLGGGHAAGIISDHRLLTVWDSLPRRDMTEGQQIYINVIRQQSRQVRKRHGASRKGRSKCWNLGSGEFEVWGRNSNPE